MKKILPLIVVAVLAAALAASLGGCGSSVSGNVTVSGSTTVQPIAQEAADQFMQKNPSVTVTVQGGGSSVGITNVSQGVSNIGTSSRDRTDQEKSLGLVDHKVAMDVVVPIVNPGVTVSSLTLDQLKNIYLGTVKNWNEVGGSNAPIVVIVRDEASGTRELWDGKVLGKSSTNPVKPVSGALETNSNGVMRQKVASTSNSIGYVSSGYVDKSVKALQINGVTGNVDNALNKTYPLSRFLHMFTKGEATGSTKSYIDFVTSDDFQNNTVSKSYIPLTKIPASEQ